MTKIYSFFTISTFLILGSISAFSSDQYGSSQTVIGSESRSPERFFRRIIIEGSLANAGYEGGGSGRYSKPNGYSVGVLFDLLGRAGLVFEAGALYRQFGTTYINGLGDNTFTANYISVPLGLKYYFGGQETTSLYIKGGVMGSTLISNNTLYETPTTQIGARSWETAVIGGLGFKFELSSDTGLILEAGYARSFDSVFNNTNVYRSDLNAALG